MTTPAYSHQQIIYALNSIANAPSDRTGTVRELETFAGNVITNTFASPKVQELIGEWELVWGPAVYQASDSNVADNAMYIARSKITSTDFVVAISGTNPISKYGWIHEDFLINPMHDWPYASGLNPQPRISNGTKIGLDALLALTYNSKQNLTDYLGQQVVAAGPKPLSVTVTGHSLGGALSPAIALALKNMQGKASDWDPNSIAKIAVEPTAGPTPGDKAWAEYYNSQLGDSTDRLWNKIDIVPHAWQLDMLAAIPTLYKPTLPTSIGVCALVFISELNSCIAGDMYQIRDDVPGLPGKVRSSVIITDLLEILEILAANYLIDKLAEILKLSAKDTMYLKELVDVLIIILNDLLKSAKSVTKGELKALNLDTRTRLEADSKCLLDHFFDFLIFIRETLYQHTHAYAELLGTTEFDSLYQTIKKGTGKG